MPHAATSSVQLRTPHGEVVTRPLRGATPHWLRTGVQFREFSYRPRQKHFPGQYWSATMAGHVGHESRLELANLLLIDFDPTAVVIHSQPFQFVESIRNKTLRRHVPDYLVQHADGRIEVVDVKTRAKLTEPKVRAQFSWTAELCAGNGWEHSVVCEPDDTLLANVRFLAGYRRAWQFRPEDVTLALEQAKEPVAFAAFARAIADNCGGYEFAKAIVLHLLWSQRLTTDLEIPLQATSIVRPEPTCPS